MAKAELGCSYPLVGIYALVDPRDREPRYVGRSRRPRARYLAHVSVSSMCRKENRRRYEWVRELAAKGLRPSLVILERCHITAAPEAEQRWIDTFRPRGMLFNAKGRKRTQLVSFRLDWQTRSYR